jgi:VWFA-related protein
MRSAVARLALPIAALMTAAALASAGAGQSADGGELIEIDAVVIDGRGRPVHGLAMSDFSVREDGRPVTLSTFREVRAAGGGDPDAARSIVLLLDDSGVSPTGTQAVQTIARAVVASADKVDDVAVVRLHSRGDEPFGDRLTAESRIRGYRGGAAPFAFASTPRELLERIVEIAPLVAANSSQRRLIVCIGSAEICNVPEPLPTSARMYERVWNDAISAAARANVAVYALVPGRSSLGGDRLTDFTGGAIFASTYDFGPPIDRILRDASNYYVLGYWAPSGERLHRVQVRSGVNGARVQARKAR